MKTTKSLAQISIASMLKHIGGHCSQQSDRSSLSRGFCLLPGAKVHPTYSPFNQVRGLVTWQRAERVVDAIPTSNPASERVRSST